jgi:membrane protein
MTFGFGRTQAAPRTASRGQSRVEAALALLMVFSWTYLLSDDLRRGREAQVRMRRSDPLGADRFRRAQEAGRGRRASSPLAIPARGWKDILWRVYREVQQDRLLAVAAGVVFYSLLAVVPAITAFVSSYGLFVDPLTIAGQLAFIQDVMPAAAYEIVRNQIERIVGQDRGGLTVGFAFGLAVAIWSANAATKALFDGLNVVYDEQEKRSFIRLNLVSLAVTAGAILVLILLLGSVVVFPVALSFFGAGSIEETLVAFGRWPALFLIVVTALSVLYRVGPSRARAKWRWLSIGSLFGALAWLGASLLLSWYMSNFADYNATYGSLGAVIGLMMWMWLSAVAVLLGGELNAEIEHQTARDSTVGPEKPLGERGAVMADTVGVAAQ